VIGQSYQFPEDVVVTIQVVAPRELTSEEIAKIVLPLFRKVEELQGHERVYGDEVRF
jgi:hypothetical protein